MGIERRQGWIGGAILAACFGMSIVGHVAGGEPTGEPDDALSFEPPEPVAVALRSVRVDDAPALEHSGVALRLGCDAAGEVLVDAALEAAFEARSPAIDLVSVPGSEATSLAELREGKLDAVLLTRPLTHREWRKGLRALEVVRVAFAAVASPRFAVFDLERGQLGDLVTGRARDWARMRVASLPVSIELLAGPDPLLATAMQRLFPGMTSGVGARRHPSIERLFTRVAAMPGSLSLVPLARVDRRRLKIVTIGGVYPTFETIRSGAYPLVFPVVYVTKAAVRGPGLSLRAFLRAGGARSKLRVFGLPSH